MTAAAEKAMKLHTLYSSPNYYSVCECVEGGRLVLVVVCGGVAMYSVVIELSAEEEAEFASEGHLDALARHVAQRESDFADRKLVPSDGNDGIEFIDEP